MFLDIGKKDRRKCESSISHLFGLHREEKGKMYTFTFVPSLMMGKFIY